MFRNFHTLTGCTLAATDGKIGKVREIYFDDAHWTMRYLVVTCGFMAHRARHAHRGVPDFYAPFPPRR